MIELIVYIRIAVEGYAYLSFTNVYPAQTATVYEHDILFVAWSSCFAFGLIRHTSKAGIRALPFYGCFIIALILASIYATKAKDAVTPVIVGYCLYTAALIGFAVANEKQSSLFIGMDCLAGLGFAAPLTFLTIIAQFAVSFDLYMEPETRCLTPFLQVPPHLIATATAITLSLRALGGAIG